MESQTGILIRQMISEVQDLPDQMLREVLDFMRTLKQKEKGSISRGSPEAILHHAGAWTFEPGELDSLLTDIATERESEA